VVSLCLRRCERVSGVVLDIHKHGCLTNTILCGCLMIRGALTLGSPTCCEEHWPSETGKIYLISD